MLSNCRPAITFCVYVKSTLMRTLENLESVLIPAKKFSISTTSTLKASLNMFYSCCVSMLVARTLCIFCRLDRMSSM